MGNLKEVRNRIASVTSTRQITSAMKLVSASKLKRAQDNITKMRPYAKKLKEILDNLGNSAESASESPYAAKREVKKVLIVVVTSNKGLCGAFNANVIKRTNLLLNEYKHLPAENISLLCVGRKAYPAMARKPNHLLPLNDSVVDKPTFANANEIAESIMAAFVDGVYDRVEIVYNEFKTAASQNVIVEQFLPIAPESSEVKTVSKEYIYQPNKEDILLNLIPASLKTRFFKVILDSQAAEHGARMTAMHKATDNAGELLKELKLSYNKARQAAITGEILEIVAGAEALN
jgi:F-type H+-transporting ATPase subunit gamma